MIKLTIGQRVALNHYLWGYDYESSFNEILESIVNNNRSTECAEGAICVNEDYEELDGETLRWEIKSFSEEIDDEIDRAIKQVENKE